MMWISIESADADRSMREWYFALETLYKSILDWLFSHSFVLSKKREWSKALDIIDTLTHSLTHAHKLELISILDDVLWIFKKMLLKYWYCFLLKLRHIILSHSRWNNLISGIDLYLKNKISQKWTQRSEIRKPNHADLRWTFFSIIKFPHRFCGYVKSELNRTNSANPAHVSFPSMPFGACLYKYKLWSTLYANFSLPDTNQQNPMNRVQTPRSAYDTLTWRTRH